MDGKPEPREWIAPGKNLDGAVRGMATPSNHSRSHARELGTTSTGLEAKARQVVNSADTGVQIQDAAGNRRFVLGNQTEKAVAWVTPHKSEQSTVFSHKNPQQYVAGQLEFAGARGERIDPPAIRAQAKLRETPKPPNAPSKPSTAPIPPKPPTPVAAHSTPPKAMVGPANKPQAPKPSTPPKPPSPPKPTIVAPKPPSPPPPKPPGPPPGGPPKR